MGYAAYDQHHKLSQEEQRLLNKLDTQHKHQVAQLIHLTEINSSSLNPKGVNQVGKLFAEMFTPISDQHQHIKLPQWQRMGFDGQIDAQPLGDLWRFRKRPEAPVQILLTGHLDTVFPINSSFQQATHTCHNRLNAPGAADMKGGILVMFSALQLLEQHPYASHIGWTVLLNPDEEIGSPGSAEILTEESRRHHLGLIYEPALPDGNLAGERKGSGNFSFAIHGRAAHAGREPEKGRNALTLAAELTLQLNQLNGQRPELTLNVGMLKGGETTNQVPDLAVLKFNIRIKAKEDADWCQQQLQKIEHMFSQRDGYKVELHGGFGRMPKQFDPVHTALYELVQSCALDIGEELQWVATGGCCDGNNLSAAGLPNVDTLGVHGNYIHSSDEYVELNSLTSRAKLSALILFHLANHGLPFSHTTQAINQGKAKR